MKRGTFTVLSGTMRKTTARRIKSISAQLKMSEAEAVEWAIMRCGLRISIPSKFYPTF